MERGSNVVRLTARKLSSDSSPSSSSIVSLKGTSQTVVGTRKTSIVSLKSNVVSLKSSSSSSLSSPILLHSPTKTTGKSNKKKQKVKHGIVKKAPAAAIFTPTVAPSQLVKVAMSSDIEIVEESEEKKQQRAERFRSQREAPYMAAKVANGACVNLSGIKALRGTCQNLEKHYHRENAKTAIPEEIRPVEVLMESLQMVKRKWIETGDYPYCCDQLKSIQQDLMLQHIETALTIDAYESHARLALEQRDFQELTRCQVRLGELYVRDINTGLRNHQMEFTAYRLLLLLHDRADAMLESSRCIRQLTTQQRQDPDVAFAVRVTKAYYARNYFDFWTLYNTAPKMAGFAIDAVAEHLRKDQLHKIIKAIAPTVSISFLCVVLGFPAESNCIRYLRQQHCVLSDQHNVDCKATKKIFDSHNL